MERRRMVAPSILSADFSRMSAEIASLGGKADYLHCDVMDGVFVPNITFGPKMIADIKKNTDTPLDVHLMISRPEEFVPLFAKAGADIITVHAEATLHLNRLVALIKATGARAGVALNPATPLSALDYVLEDIDLALVMSVNPGFGGQSFIPQSLRKIAELRARADALGLNTVIEVDGGVSAGNAAAVYGAGAELLVAGSAVFVPDAAARADIIEAIRCAR